MVADKIQKNTEKANFEEVNMLANSSLRALATLETTALIADKERWAVINYDKKIIQQDKNILKEINDIEITRSKKTKNLCPPK